MHTIAYGYVSLPEDAAPNAEQRLRWSLLEYARLEGLDLRRVFVDSRDEDGAYGFDALRVVLARKPDVRAVILPDLSHVAHIPLVAAMTAAELGRFLGVPVRLALPEPAPPPAVPQPLAVGLVHRPVGTPTPDRMWARAVVVRHARDARLQLVDVLELDDDPHRSRAVLCRLHQVATTSRVAVLVTDGLDADLAQRLAHDLGLEHQVVTPKARPLRLP